LKIVKEKWDIRQPGFGVSLGVFRLSGLTLCEVKAVPEIIAFTSDSLKQLLSLDIECQVFMAIVV
jgi:hypothetical protein